MININQVLLKLSQLISAFKDFHFLSWDRFCNIFTKQDLTVSNIVNGANWTHSEVSASLIGHQMYVKVRSKRSSATEAGDIANQNIVSFSVNHGGKIKEAYTISSGNIDGQIATFQITSGIDSTNSNLVNITVKLVATHAKTSSAYVDDYVPVAININRY